MGLRAIYRRSKDVGVVKWVCRILRMDISKDIPNLSIVGIKFELLGRIFRNSMRN